MTAPRIKRTDHDEALKRELERWPGVGVYHEIRGKHRAVVLCFNGQTRKVFIPTTPSDSIRGIHNFLRDLRGELRAMGAVSVTQAKAARVRAYRPKRDRVPLTLVVDNAPTRLASDPFAKLADLTFPEPPRQVRISDPVPPSPSLFERVLKWLGWR